MGNRRRNHQFEHGHGLALPLITVSILNGDCIPSAFRQFWKIKAKNWQHLPGNQTEIRADHSPAAVLPFHPSCSLRIHYCFLTIVLRTVWFFDFNSASSTNHNLLLQPIWVSIPKTNGVFQRDHGNLYHVLDHLLYRFYSWYQHAIPTRLRKHSLDLHPFYSQRNVFS